MLQAKLNNGALITLYQYSKEEIEAIRATEEFFCPTCSERVIIKAGPKIIPHFAHQKSSACISSEGGEGVYHEKGKLLLYEWLVKQRLDTSLEAYIPEIKQRADILVRINQKLIALEFQCAKIALTDIQKRTYGYLTEGIQPIWILGANHFKRKGKHKIKADQFILQFLHQYRSDLIPIIYFFDPHTKLIIMASNPYFTRQTEMIVKLKIQKLHTTNMLDLFQPVALNQKELFSAWQTAKVKFRIHQPQKLFGKELAWYQWLYYKGTHREKLPSIVYLPVQTQFKMKTQPWDWQSRICLEIINPLPIGGRFSLQRCVNQLQNSFLSDPYPLITSSTNPIQEYLQLLCDMQIIKQTSNTIFIKCKEITHYQHIDEAIEGDKQLLNELFKITSQNTSMNHN